MTNPFDAVYANNILISELFYNANFYSNLFESDILILFVSSINFNPFYTVTFFHPF